jgi:thymidine kinase
MRKIGSIEIICGPMFSGKTTELLRLLERLSLADKKFLLFKPSFDDRYSQDCVISHSKKELKSIPIKNAQEIMDVVNLPENKSINCIAIDEAQFFDKNEKFNLIQLCFELKSRNCKVILNGLDMDCDGKPFGLMPDLMAISDRINKLTAICMYRGCGETAEMSYKKDKERDLDAENVVELGEKDLYQARCYRHWKKE